MGVEEKSGLFHEAEGSIFRKCFWKLKWWKNWQSGHGFMKSHPSTVVMRDPAPC
jgi:hypothetical protein